MPFGKIKQNLKFREFLTRGMEKVRVDRAESGMYSAQSEGNMG